MAEPITPKVIEMKLYNLTKQEKINWQVADYDEYGESVVWEADVNGLTFQLNRYGRLNIPVDKNINSPKGYEICGYVSTSCENRDLVNIVKRQCIDNNWHVAAVAASIQAFMY